MDNGRFIKPIVSKWLSRVVLDWSIIITCFFAAYQYPSPWIVMVCILVIGARQHALAILGHDGAHRLASKNRLINDLLTGLFCFWPLGFALNGYRRFHFAHHRTVGTPDDPELLHKNHRWLGQWQMPLKPAILAIQIVGDLVGGAIPHFGMAAYLTRPTSFSDQVGPMLTISTFLAISYYLECLWIPLLWFGSLGTVFFIVFRLRLWTEHVGTDTTHLITATFWQRFFFLPHNTWCHWEHHEFTAVPCWALPSMRDPLAKAKSVGHLFGELTKTTLATFADRPNQ